MGSVIFVKFVLSQDDTIQSESTSTHSLNQMNEKYRIISKK